VGGIEQRANPFHGHRDEDRAEVHCRKTYHGQDWKERQREEKKKARSVKTAPFVIARRVLALR
jgi:hypothetical protein